MTAHPDLIRQERARPSAIADRMSNLLDPGIVVAALVLAVARAASPGWLPALGWSALIVTFAVLLPYAALALLVRTGRVADRHVIRRDERHLPALIALVSVVVGTLVLTALNAPRDLLALVWALVAGVATLGLVTTLSKASLHTAVIAGAVTILTIRLGAGALLLSPLVALVGWARWRAGRHTGWQVALGAALGAASAGLTFAGLR